MKTEKLFRIRASQSGAIMGIKGLGKTGETYVENWLKEQIYNRKKEFSNKYTEKGNIMEDESIDFVAKYLDLGMLIKNERQFENDFFIGTPDIITKDYIIDVKNSWDCFTFPLFEQDLPNKEYYYQGQVYMSLTGISKYKVIYTLMDTPEHLIEKEAYFYCKNNGYDELDEDVYNSFKEKMTYKNIDNSLKIKVFEFEKNNDVIDLIKNRVIDCRNYLSKLSR
jgi:hypothetical protein